jgi:Flp pilus assembly pilin Flp
VSRLRRLFVGEGGQAAVEYGLIAAALIACLVVAGGGIVQIQKAVFESQHKGLQDWRAP